MSEEALVSAAVFEQRGILPRATLYKMAKAGRIPSYRVGVNLGAYERASASGIAAIDFEGQMVDEPLAARARQILATAAKPEEKR